MLVPLTRNSLPPKGVMLTDGKRLMEIEDIDSEGIYWLVDCMSDLDRLDPSFEPLKLSRGELVAAGWKRVIKEGVKHAA